MAIYKSTIWRVSCIITFSLAAGKSFAFRTEPSSKYEKIIHNVTGLIEQAHYNPKKVDDAFSKEVFTTYLVAVNPNKNILMQPDIDALSKYSTKIDDEMHGSGLEFSHAVSEIFDKRRDEAEQIYKEILKKPFNFSIKETANLKFDSLPWPKNEAERKEYWYKSLKYQTLARYADALDARDKNKDKKDFVYKADTTLERESRNQVEKITSKTFDRLKSKFKEEDKFNLYINTICGVMDPHTAYFAPVEKRMFDETMSGKFYGIGAQLIAADGAIKILGVITGGPTWKGGQISANDIILKVAQGDAEPVDVSGFETEDAVKLIRGTKGSEVRLTVKKEDGSVKVVSIIREEIVTEEKYARSLIVNKGGKKIGYIFLPEFYVNLNDENGQRCSTDVAIEVEKLKAEHVDGIVMDLRNNPGGSLTDVVRMVGLFVDGGPVVQVRNREGQSNMLENPTGKAIYTGPLTVMINEASASASEIFAAAIQDYKRGVIIGANSFGKGTVQRSLSLDRDIDFSAPQQQLGAMNLTIQKFYRINGGATQLKGVTPDILLPDTYEYAKFGEKDRPDALAWDEIERASYSPLANNFNKLDLSADKRIQANPVFAQIHKNSLWLSEKNNRSYNLNLKDYQANQKQVGEIIKQTRELLSLKSDSLDLHFIAADKEKIDKMDTLKSDFYNVWLKALTKDIYLDETLRVLSEMIVDDKVAKKD